MQKLNLTPDLQLEPSPDPTAFDRAMTAAKVGALALTPVLPFVGPGVAFIDLLTTPLRGKRMADWCEEFRLRFNDLSQKVEGLTWEKLEKDEAFFSAFVQATQTAIKTHQKEKLEALRNAVFNVALGEQPDPNRQQQFFALLDRFSETHLMVLKFLTDPAGHFQKQGKPVPHVAQGEPKLLVNNLIADAMPSLRKSASPEERSSTAFQFIELILRDLVSNRLVTLVALNDTWAVPTQISVRRGGTAVQKMATHLGEDFLAFITEAWIEEGKK